MIIERLTAALADRYRIERELGAGGMATVYLAHDLRHDRNVALKVLRPELAAVIGAERFLKEIKTTANLQHPHILGLIDSGDASGLLWYAMPFVEGESLRDRLQREKQLPIPDAVRIATEVAGALDYAHRHGVIHRDIKPENILLHDGSALVADFGIALAASTAGTRMTETGMSLGTPHYMSPEQAMGEREITARSDVYALGCVTYEMLIGDPPFTGSTAQAIVAKVVTERPRSLIAQRHTIPAHIEAAVLTSLEKLPADRFATAAEFAAALADRSYSTTGAAAYAPVRTVRSALPWALFGMATIAAVLLGARPWRRPTDTPGQVVRAILELPPAMSIGYSSLALTQDGTRLVVMVAHNGENQIYQRQLDGLEFTPVPGTETSMHPFLSPDGRWVAFAAKKQMRKAPLDGGPVADIAPSSWAGGDWGTNGTIVYTQAYQTGLWRVAAGGGTPERLSVPDSSRGELAHWWPQLLPDGDHVLFTAYRSPIEKASIEVLSLKTGKRTVLVEGGSSARYVTAGYLLYAKNETLFAAPFDAGKLKMTGQAVPVLPDVAMESSDGLAAYTVSDNGTLAYIAASTYVPAADLVWVSRHGEASAPITTPARFYNPAISPDAQRIALAIARPGESKDLWVLDLARGTRTALTSGGANHFGPIFTPGGDRVVFQSEEPIFDLYVRAADGSSPATPLVVSAFDKSPTTISADGKMLFFEYHSVPHNEIWTVPLDGSTAPTALLTSAAADLRSPSISPNGKWLAYSSNESGRPEVYVSPYPAVTSGRRQVSADGGMEMHWTRNGRELVYTSGPRMMAVAVDPATGVLGQPIELFHGAYTADPAGHSFDVTSDGERFLMIRRPMGAEPRQIVVVTNWFTELRRKMAR